jgi:hypothetical protein
MQKSAVSLIFITILLGGIILSVVLIERPSSNFKETPFGEIETDYLGKEDGITIPLTTEDQFEQTPPLGSFIEDIEIIREYLGGD